MKHETSDLPGLLYSADGTIVNSILLKHEREFTLLFLRETVTGRRLADHSLLGPCVLSNSEMPKLLGPDEAPITIRPTTQDIDTYGQSPKTALTAAQASHDDVEDYLEAQFVKRFRYAAARRGLNDKVDMQRSALVLAMERVLDCVQAKDVDAFMQAQRDMEAAIQLGINMLDPELKDAGMEKAERMKFFETLGEGQIKMVIRGRLKAISDEAHQAAFYKFYEHCMHAYKEEIDHRQSAPRVSGPLNGGIAERISDHKPLKPSFVDKYVKGELSPPSACNDNGRA